MLSSYLLLKFVHIVLFAYWLGADLGVYFAAHYVARADLEPAERLRFLGLLAKLDMGPRTALILMLPVGIHLGHLLGLIGLSGTLLALIWLVASGWLALTWYLYLAGARADAMLRRIDFLLRVAVIFSTILAGITSLAGIGPVATGWLAVKFILFGGVVACGLMLRRTLRDWQRGFANLGTAGHDAANALIHPSAQTSHPWAYALWALLLTLAFLGTVKPL